MLQRLGQIKLCGNQGGAHTVQERNLIALCIDLPSTSMLRKIICIARKGDDTVFVFVGFLFSCIFVRMFLSAWIFRRYGVTR